MATRTSISTSIIILLLASWPAYSATGVDPNTQPASNSKAQEQFELGRRALFQGNYHQAVELLKKAAQQDPSKTGYRLHLARAYYYAHNEKQAEQLLAEILKTTPDHVEAGQLLAEIYNMQNKSKQLVDLLEPLLQYRHDYATYHLLAEAKYNLNDYPSARKYFEQAIKLNPNSGPDHYQLGNIYLAGNFFALAAESYESAMRLGIELPVLHYKLGSAYFNLRNYFGKVARVRVKSGKPGAINGQWYLIEPVPGTKDAFYAAPAKSAVYQVAKAITGGLSETPDIKFLLANIYLNAKRYQQAHEMLKEIEAVVPEEDKALFYYYYAQSAFGIHRYGEYLALLAEAIKIDEATYGSALVDAYLKVADRYNQAGQLDKYIEYLEKAVQQSPETASLHLKLGYAYEQARLYPQAVVQWRMVLDLEPDHPDGMHLLNLIGKYDNSPAEPPEPEPAGERNQPGTRLQDPRPNQS